MSYWTSWEKGVSQYTQDCANGIHVVISLRDKNGIQYGQRTSCYFVKGGGVLAGSRGTYERYGCDWSKWMAALREHVPTIKDGPFRYHVETLRHAEELEWILALGQTESVYALPVTEEERKEALHAAIEQLPPAQHDAIVLWLSGRLHAEIAEILGCTARQSQDRVYEAKVSLRTKFIHSEILDPGFCPRKPTI